MNTTGKALVILSLVLQSLPILIVGACVLAGWRDEK